MTKMSSTSRSDSSWKELLSLCCIWDVAPRERSRAAFWRADVQVCTCNTKPIRVAQNFIMAYLPQLFLRSIRQDSTKVQCVRYREPYLGVWGVGKSLIQVLRAVIMFQVSPAIKLTCGWWGVELRVRTALCYCDRINQSA